MNGFFDFFLGSEHKPIRREVNVRVTFDSDGNPTVEPDEGEASLLSEDGSIDTIRYSRDRFFHCGHSTQAVGIGGQCLECQGIDCVQCFGHCEACSKPLCLEHSVYLESPDLAKPLRLCVNCHEALRQQLFRQRVTRALLRPFTR